MLHTTDHSGSKVERSTNTVYGIQNTRDPEFRSDSSIRAGLIGVNVEAPRNTVHHEKRSRAGH